MKRCAPLVGRHVLARLVRGGVGGVRGEMGQACFKALSLLFKNQVHVFGVILEEGGENGKSGAGSIDEGGGGIEYAVVAGVAADAKQGIGGGRRSRRSGDGLLGLSPKQMRALLVVLQIAVAETEHQNATFGLIKAVVSKKVLLPEVRGSALCLPILCFAVLYCVMFFLF